MQMKRYTIASFILMVLVWLFISNYIPQGTEKISIDFFGYQLPTFSIAFWTVVPLFVLYVASILHFSLYSVIASFKLKKYKKDYNQLIEAISDAYLGKKDRVHNFKTDRYKLLGALIDNSTIFPNQDIRELIDDEKINKIIKMIEDVKSGKVVELKKYALDEKNPIVEQNDRNRYKNGDVKAKEILAKKDRYSQALVTEVFSDFVKDAPLQAIENNISFLTKDTLFHILGRINAEENTLEISHESLKKLILSIKLSSLDYIEVSRILSKSMIPEQRIKLFESLAEENSDIIEAQLYTLFDLEVNDIANEILQNSQESEYVNFKSYRALKDCNKNFSIELFV